MSVSPVNVARRVYFDFLSSLPSQFVATFPYFPTCLSLQVSGVGAQNKGAEVLI
jgi:hypothetical protein